MSGFSPHWLALREAADHASVDRFVREQVCAYFENSPSITITDIGSGTGSSLRGLAPFLANRQTWHLVDHDPHLLDKARNALAAWADVADDSGERLNLRFQDKTIHVNFVQQDIGAEVPGHIYADADLVTSAAFFDLVSGDWIERFASALARARLPLYAMLTYNGEETWHPAHAYDAAILRAFHADQHRNKGFGPAAGPQAAAIMQARLEGLGYNVLSGDSAWELGNSQNDLIASLAQGIADAVAAGGACNGAQVRAWLQARRKANSCRIGHTDIFAQLGL